MRRFFAIWLIFVFLLYHAGYYVFYLTLRHKVECSWRLKVENNNLDVALLQTRSIPITFAYQQELENTMPELNVIEIKGEHFRVVKQHYSKDTLHIVYIQDRSSEKLDGTLRDWVKSLTQKPNSDKNNNTNTYNTLEKNYLPNSIVISLPMAPGITSDFGTAFNSDFISRDLDVATPPPKA